MNERTALDTGQILILTVPGYFLFFKVELPGEAFWIRDLGGILDTITKKKVDSIFQSSEFP